MAAHISSALVAIAGLPFGHVVGPLIVYLIKGHESEFVAEHARASLNYQITISIVMIVGGLAAAGAMIGTTVAASGASDTEHSAGIVVTAVAIGIAFLLVLLFSLIFIIAGTLAASEGRPYNYPFAIRFLR